ncbi:MAG: hypothetical protein ABR562_10065, partial [Thermoplasmatota archaeon]
VNAETVKQHQDAALAIAKNEKHVILAYAAMWVIAAGFVLFLWRRQQHLKTEIAQLRRDLDAAGAPGFEAARLDGLARAPRDDDGGDEDRDHREAAAARLGLDLVAAAPDPAAGPLAAIDQELRRAGLALADLAAAPRGRSAGDRAQAVAVGALLRRAIVAWAPAAHRAGARVHL